MPVDLSRVNKNTAMGATVRANGTGFRTWAPNARQGYVVTGGAPGAHHQASWRPAPAHAFGRRGGRKLRGRTFLGVIEKREPLQNLGVNAIQLLPVQEFETAFSMGYNGVDYFSPEGAYAVAPEQLGWRLARINRMLERFGKPPLTLPELVHCTNQLKCLVDLCHLHGIAVIFDLVYNHAGGGFDARSIWFYDRQARDNT